MLLTLLLAGLLSVGVGAAPSNYVAVEQDDGGRWWFAHGGERFVSLGVNHVNNGGQDDGVGGRESSQCKAKTGNALCGDSLSFAGKLGYAPYYNSTQGRYGPNETVWAEAAVGRLQDWGFNTLGGWSAVVAEEAGAGAGMYYAHLLDMGTTWLNHGKDGLDHDVFSDAFTAQAAAIAAKEVAPRANDSQLLGWQLDNELQWTHLNLVAFLSFANQSSPGVGVAVNWLSARYNASIDALNTAWNITATSFADVHLHLLDAGIALAVVAADSEAFLVVSAAEYFRKCHDAIRAHDSFHLILGVRQCCYLPVEVQKAWVPYIDVIDYHEYSVLPNVTFLADLHTNGGGKPVYIGEFSFTAMDSQLPNTVGARANQAFITQTQRAQAYAAYVQLLLAQPFAIGYHWWQWADEPATGRWPDGEDSNYGTVHVCDDPYGVLTAEFTRVNPTLHDLHASSPMGRHTGRVDSDNAL